MEALKSLFKAKAEFVRSSEDEGNSPTDEQLESFMRNLSAETGLALRGAPAAVRLTNTTVVVQYGSLLILQYCQCRQYSAVRSTILE